MNPNHNNKCFACCGLNQEYGLLFAINILAMGITNIVNIRLVEQFKLFTILRSGSLIAAVSALLLLLNTVTGFGSLPGLMIPIACYIACIGLTGPNSNALALAHFPKSAGTANALAGALRFTMGGIASALVGYLHNGTAIPMAAVMAGLRNTLYCFIVAGKERRRRSACNGRLVHGFNEFDVYNLRSP